MENILNVQGLQKSYGTKDHVIPVLKGIDMTVEKGEFLAIMGPSGAGKSTLLHLLAAIDVPTSGSIRLNSIELSSMNEAALADFRREHLGFIFQDYNLLDSLTIKENILLPLSLSGESAKTMEKKVHEAADVLSITGILEKYPHAVSGGQKQRTAAARAIITSPSLILADEPTGALDSRSSADLLSAFNRLNDRFKSTILMVTHDPFAASFCDRVLFIKDGNLFTELVKGDKERKQFFEQLLTTLSALGGGGHEFA